MQFEHSDLNKLKIKIPDMTLVSSMYEFEKLEKRYHESIQRTVVSSAISFAALIVVAAWDFASIAFIVPLMLSMLAGVSIAHTARMIEPVEGQRKVMKDLKPAIEALKTPYVSNDGLHIIFGYECLDTTLSSKQALVLNIPTDYHPVIERYAVNPVLSEAVEHYIESERLTDSGIIEDIKYNQWVLGEISDPAKDLLKDFYQNKLSINETPYYKSLEEKLNHQSKMLHGDSVTNNESDD